MKNNQTENTNQDIKSILINHNKQIAKFSVASLITSSIAQGATLGTAINQNFHAHNPNLSALPWVLFGVFTLASVSNLVMYFKHETKAAKLEKEVENEG